MDDISAHSELYRGFTISVTPQKDNEDLWDFTYQLHRDGEPVSEVITRSRTLGGYAAPDTARLAGLEVAKIEVDNLLRP